MPRILHLSDLHFGRERRELVRAVQTQARELAPDLIAISGDLTQRARRQELEAARRFVDELPAPVLVVPGNHDIPGVSVRRLTDPWSGWRRVFPAGTNAAFSGPGLSAIGANSVRIGGLYLDWSRGGLSETQVTQLAARIARAPRDDLRVLVLHHPLLLTREGRHRGLVGGASSALPRLANAGLDLALGGHVHLPYAGLAQRVVVAHAATGVSNRLVGAPNGFNLIDADAHSISVSHWFARNSRFEPGPPQIFPRRTADAVA
jgi:3',5'-cyclic AMP phosphodiesterase CpdA